MAGYWWWCYYLRCNEGLSCSTWSHIGGSWNFPNFLFRDGSFTLMYMASLIFLVNPVPPCPLWKNILGWLGVLMWMYVGVWMRVLEVFLVSVTEGSSWFPYVLFCAVYVGASVPVNDMNALVDIKIHHLMKTIMLKTAWQQIQVMWPNLDHSGHSK